MKNIVLKTWVSMYKRLYYSVIRNLLLYVDFILRIHLRQIEYKLTFIIIIEIEMSARYLQF